MRIDRCCAVRNDIIRGAFTKLTEQEIAALCADDITVDDHDQRYWQIDKAVWDKVEGWCTPVEGDWLEQTAARYAQVWELGAWKGRSTIRLARGAWLAGGHVFSVDHHTGGPDHRRINPAPIDTFPEWLANIARCDLLHVVTPIIMHNDKASFVADAYCAEFGPIGLLYIDASHEPEDILRDYALFAPLLGIDGTIAFHDYGIVEHPGVRQIVNANLIGNPQWHNLGRVDSIFYAQRAE